jgi:muramoyltetrapeptide carboxypeptidase
MTSVNRPEKLQKGDSIGIVSPSSGIAALCPRRLKRGIETLEQMGFQVVLGKHVQKRYEYMAGSVEDRLEDLYTMFQNDEVKAIITTISGTCSHY